MHNVQQIVPKSVLGRISGATLAIFALIAQPAWSEKSLETLISPVFGEKTRYSFLDQTRSAQDFVLNEQRSGILPAASVLPNIGRLLIRARDGGAKSSCTGIAINQSYFLTAAHCVCNLVGLKAKNYEECEASLDRLSLKLFFPNRGFVAVEGRPFVNPMYRSPTYLVEGQPVDVADLAVIKFRPDLNIEPIRIGEGRGRYMVVGAGLMYFSIPKVLKELGLPEGIALHDGVFHIWRNREVFFDRDACGEMNSSDTFCNLFVPLPILRGPTQSSTVCVGDSGSPVFRLSDSGTPSVEGVASYFSPKQNEQCLDNAAKWNYYVNVANYKNWIEEFKYNNTRLDKVKTCASALFRKGESVDLLAFSGFLSATGFDARNTERPKIDIIANNKECEDDEAFGVYACKIKNSPFTSVNVNHGFVQLTLCEE